MSHRDYSGFLTHNARELTALAANNEFDDILFRDDLVEQILTLINAGRCVLLSGAPGIGKTAIIYRLAQRLASNNRNRLYEISTPEITTNMNWAGDWQTQAARLITEARDAHTYLYVSDIWNIPNAGTSDNADLGLLDMLKMPMAHGRIRLIGEVTPTQLADHESGPILQSVFSIVEVPELTEEQTRELVSNLASRAGFALDPNALNTLLTLPARFSPTTPLPGNTLRLFKQVDDYRRQKSRIGEDSEVTKAFVERVYSIYSGLPLFIVSTSETRQAQDIRAWFHERIVGQGDAIDRVVETIALFKTGLNDPTLPIGSFLFIGPDGVGKTEVARALATLLYGSPHRLLRLELSEYSDAEALARLIGSTDAPAHEGHLTGPVVAQPFQVILLKGVSHAHPSVVERLVQICETGQLRMEGGRTVDFTNTVIICTSKTNALVMKHQNEKTPMAPPEETPGPEQIPKAAAMNPALLNLLNPACIFTPLEHEELRLIVKRELRRIMVRDGFSSRGVLVEVSDDIVDWIIGHCVSAYSGAHPLKRELQARVITPLAVTLMEQDPAPGSMLNVTLEDEVIRVRAHEPAEADQATTEGLVLKLAPQNGMSGNELQERVKQLEATFGQLVSTLDQTALREEHARLTGNQRSQAFWRSPKAATRTLRTLDRIHQTLSRVDHIAERMQRLSEEFEDSTSRPAFNQTVEYLRSLEASVMRARRELITMAPSDYSDAIVVVQVVGDEDAMARDLLAQTYQDWALAQGFNLEWACVPLSIQDPVMMVVRGAYSHGYLQGESGLHHVRHEQRHAAARVAVLPWLECEPAALPRLVEQRAIKGTQAFGQRIKSRLVGPEGLTLQNHRTLAENQDLACELWPSWTARPLDTGLVIRHYQLDPTHLRDIATGWSTGRDDMLSPVVFQELLERRVDGAKAGETAG